MADVMVVALFMAYVGFNGIIGSQLDHSHRVGQAGGNIYHQWHTASGRILPLPPLLHIQSCTF